MRFGIAGWSGNTTTAIQAVIDTMKEGGFDFYRIAFKPPYEGETYNKDLIQYYLDHCDFPIIIDACHNYPPNDAAAKLYRDNIALCQAYYLRILADFPNNPRVYLEPFNEYNKEFVSSNPLYLFDYRTQVIKVIRDAGFTNPIVQNKMWHTWASMKLLADSDPLQNFYTGRHNYFDQDIATPKTFESASLEQQAGLDLGLKLINTEGGATMHHTFLDALGNPVPEMAIYKRYMDWCNLNGIRVATWFYRDSQLWEAYHAAGFMGMPVPLMYVLEVSSIIGGTTTPTGIQTVKSGTVVSIMATAAQGYRFNGWQVQIGIEPVITYPATVNPLILTVTAATTVMPLFNFVPVPPTCPVGSHWDSTANTCVPNASPSAAARSIGPFGVPGALLHQFWRLRERVIRPEVHKKLHPLV